MLDDLDKRHPGVRDEVRQAFGSPRMPEPVPAAVPSEAAHPPSIPPLNQQGLQTNQDAVNENTPTKMEESPGASSSSTHFEPDPRKVKSEETSCHQPAPDRVSDLRAVV